MKPTSLAADRLAQAFGIEIGGGRGPVKGKTWRIGLMGEASRENNVLLFLAALERCLVGKGHKWNWAPA